MGTRPVLFAVETACLCGAGNRSKQHPRKTGPPIMPVNPGSCKRLIGRVFTGAGRRGTPSGRAAGGCGHGKRQQAPEKAPVPCNANLKHSTPAAPAAGHGPALRPARPGWDRWPLTSSSARSSSPSAGLQGADGTRSRCLRPDHLRSGWPSRDPVPDGSFHGHGSGC